MKPNDRQRILLRLADLIEEHAQTIDEVVSLYNYLASDASAFITGQEIRIDGGMSTGIGGPLFTLAAEKAGL